jgi:hypothetical protein
VGIGAESEHFPALIVVCVAEVNTLFFCVLLSALRLAHARGVAYLLDMSDNLHLEFALFTMIAPSPNRYRRNRG